MNQVFARVLRVVGYLAGAALALLVLAGGAMTAYAAVDKVDQFYVLDAQPLDPDYLLKIDQLAGQEDRREKQFGHGAHRIQAGKGLILGYRSYSNGKVMTIDDEGFHKITIWLPDGVPQGAMNLNLADRSKVLVLVTQGGSAWPDLACSGHVTTGSLRIDKRGHRYQVALHGTLTPHGNGPVFRGKCQPVGVDIEFAASQLQMAELTPWLGTAGAHPYSETYR